MPLKIFQIADVHIGMKYSAYPEEIRKKLIEARFEALEKAVMQANERGCSLFVIAGDLFESLKASAADISRVRKILGLFCGAELLLLPGNHDYHDPNSDFWERFEEGAPDLIRVLKHCGRTDLQVGDRELSILAAPCDRKHSGQHRLGFLAETELDEDRFNILIAHGAIAELSPDMDNLYFTMRMEELEALPVDLCLTGHTHVPYPDRPRMETKLFNPGTPEPDGMNYRYEGSGFYIEVGEDKSLFYEQVPLGQYRFFDEEAVCGSLADLERLFSRHANPPPEKILLRLRLTGYMEKEEYERRNEILQKLKEHFAYFKVDDDALRVRFTKSVLEAEFVRDSLPYAFLESLLQSEGEQLAHLAYELMKEVSKSD
ncbi:MAG: metallophosphoesterase family protein [Peptostreptococcaceae bacterium]|nr:metallophosphoesterase family protein [Peptostreptococcaceae bacterium]